MKFLNVQQFYCLSSSNTLPRTATERNPTRQSSMEQIDSELQISKAVFHSHYGLAKPMTFLKQSIWYILLHLNVCTNYVVVCYITTYIVEILPSNVFVFELNNLQT